MHEEDFFIGRLREDLEEKKAKLEKWKDNRKVKVGKERWREKRGEW